MRRFALNACGVVAGLAVLTACGSAAVPGQAAPAAPQAATMTDLAHLVSVQTATKHTVHMQFDAHTSAGDITGTGQADFAAGNSEIAMNMTTPVGDMDMVLAGSTLYLKPPQGVLHTTKPWVQVDANGTDPVSKALAALVSEEQQTADPSAILQQITAAATIDQVSKEQVAGQPATHYVLTVDTAKLLASKAVTPQLRQLVSGSGITMPPTITYDMWVDADNLPVRFTYSENVTVRQATTKFTVDMTYTGWGQPVTIQTPPADQVGPLPAH